VLPGDGGAEACVRRFRRALRHARFRAEEEGGKVGTAEFEEAEGQLDAGNAAGDGMTRAGGGPNHANAVGDDERGVLDGAMDGSVALRADDEFGVERHDARGLMIAGARHEVLCRLFEIDEVEGVAEHVYAATGPSVGHDVPCTRLHAEERIVGPRRERGAIRETPSGTLQKIARGGACSGRSPGRRARRTTRKTRSPGRALG